MKSAQTQVAEATGRADGVRDAIAAAARMTHETGMAIAVVMPPRPGLVVWTRQVARRYATCVDIELGIHTIEVRFSRPVADGTAAVESERQADEAGNESMPSAAVPSDASERRARSVSALLHAVVGRLGAERPATLAVGATGREPSAVGGRRDR